MKKLLTRNLGLKLASLVLAFVLWFLVAQIYDPKDTESLISELHVQEARDLITNGNVGGGMIPKLQGCIDAIENGVSRVHIMDGRIQHCLLLEIFTNKGIGTAILGENKEKFNHEDK